MELVQNSNKQCVLNINNSRYYVCEYAVLDIPYFKSMYSGNFNDELEDVDYKTMREYTINFESYCDEYIKYFIEFLTYDVGYCNTDGLNEVDKIFQMMKLFDDRFYYR